MSGEALVLASCAASIATLGAGASIVARPRARTLGLGALLGAWLLAVLAILPSSLAEHRPLLALVLAAGVAVAWFLEPLLRGREHLLLAAGAGGAVFRVPVPTGDGTAMLLLPVYVVIGLGTVIALRRTLGAGAEAPDSLGDDRGWATRMLDVAVLAQPAVAAASMLWSADRAATIETLAFFHIPFLLGYLLVRRWVRTGADIRGAAIALLAGIAVAAVVGLYQAATHEVWWNDKVIDANRFRADFRTNSLFWDPNIFGRALVYGTLLVVALSLAGPRRPAAAFPLVLTLTGVIGALWTTYSQSSWFALAAALAVLGVLTLPPRSRRWAAGVIVVGCVVATPLAIDALRGRDASGRLAVVHAGLELAQERPLVGQGAGAFERAAIDRAREDGRYNSGLTASHTTPVTVVAELGIVGVATYLALLVSVVATILARWRRTSSPAAEARRRGEPDAGTGWPSAAVIWSTGALVALVAQSLLYAAFYEDPLLWAALGILASLPAVEPSGRPIE